MIQQIPNSLPKVNEKDQSFKKTGEERKSVIYFLRALLPSVFAGFIMIIQGVKIFMEIPNLHPFSHALV